MSSRIQTGICFHAIVIIVLVTGIKATAVDCIDYSEYLHWLNCEQEVYAIGLTLIGDLAYVSANGDGFRIYDVADPANPVLLGSTVTPGNCLGNIVIGDLAYVADGYSPGFCIIDVSDASTPTVIGSAGSGSGYCNDLAMVVPDTVWVNDIYYGIRIFNVMDPAAPELIGGFSTSASRSLDVFGGHVYVADNAGLKVYSVAAGADVGNQVGFVAIAGIDYGLFRVGNLYYVTGEAGMTVVDVGDPENPFIVNQFETQGTGIRMQAEGDLGYIAEDGGSFGLSGLEIVDLTIPGDPVPVSRLTTHEACQDVFLSGNRAFLAGSYRGLFAADISSPTPAFLLSVLALPVANEVTIAGNLAYVPGQSFGLQIIDISSPAAPEVVGIYDPATYPVDVFIRGDRAYLASGILEIVDISDPATPTLVGSVNPLGTVNAVTVQGDWAYLAAQDRGLQVIDISVETAPLERAALTTPDWLHGLVARDGYLYMACDLAGLQVVDISDPQAPSLAGSLALPGSVVDVTLFGDLAFISASERGLHIVDISNPEVPTLVSTLGTPGRVFEAVVDTNLVYLADYFSGLQIADVSDPASPFLIGSLETPTHRVYGIALADNCVCIADFAGGLAIAPLQCKGVSAVPDSPAVSSVSLSAYPNPFNPNTRIVFETSGPVDLNLRVYDVAGRLVRTLMEHHHLSGRLGVVDWNGRDDQGRILAAGVYLCRLETGETVTITPVVLVK